MSGWRKRRAEAVCDVLVTKGPESFSQGTIGYYGTRLARPGAPGTADGAELSRRVTFVIETPAGAATVAVLSDVH